MTSCAKDDMERVIELLNQVVIEVNKLHHAMNTVIATQRSHGTEIEKLVQAMQAGFDPDDSSDITLNLTPLPIRRT